MKTKRYCTYNHKDKRTGVNTIRKNRITTESHRYNRQQIEEFISVTEPVTRILSWFVAIGLFLFAMFKLCGAFNNPSSFIQNNLVTLIVISSAITTIWLTYEAMKELTNLKKGR
jgi:hypothetical protein